VTGLETKASKTAPISPDPDVIAQEIVEDLQAALGRFAEIAADLKK
jgi:hypothetical protein